MSRFGFKYGFELLGIAQILAVGDQRLHSGRGQLGLQLRVDVDTLRKDSSIQLFMHGGPSHVDTFDPKPLLATLDGKPVPPSFGKANFQFTRMDTVPLMASQRVFKKRSQSGIEISDLFEHTAHFADDLAVVRSCYHDGFTHVIGHT